MPIINNPFNGKLNLDVAEYRITNGDYLDALNITKDAQGRGQDRVVSNILGNTLLPYTLPAGTNKIIGFYADRVRNRAYYFLWNSGGYNSILYYDVDANLVAKVLESKTDSNGVDILNFNPSYKVLSVNLYYRDDEGDILFFNDGLNPPRSLNVNNVYGTDWKAEYLLVAKAPPIMPPQVVYENDTTITVNNLRNKLFQFSYRYVYDNNEKSVWSSNSIVPLPQQPTLTLTDNNAENNARIAVVFSTGGPDVKAIELCFRETTSGFTSDWYLIKSFNKQDLINPISDNDVYNFRFYNDAIYSQIDVIETSQLQDWVPQKANAGELANGNVLLYAGITEGFDKTPMDLSVSGAIAQYGFYYDICGLGFFVIVNGNTSGTGTIMNIYLYGTGVNTSGTVTQLNNATATYCINSFDLDGNDLSISYVNIDSQVVDILTDISTALQANGYTQVSIDGNHLTMQYSAGFVLASSGVKYSEFTIENTEFANVWDSGYQYAVQYFDAQGRTIGAQTSINGTTNTPSRVLDIKFPQTTLSILNRPPLYATYYQVLRSNNTTFNKRLCWVSESAFTGLLSSSDNTRFLYIGVGNISAYNELISSTQNVVSYNYTEGDRIRFIRRYDSDNAPQTIPDQYDYEIVGTVATFDYNITYPAPIAPDNNTYTATGNFLKIRYPSNDIGVNFQFPGTAEWQHFEILLYNYTSNSSSTQRFYYEFGKQFGIGSPGTAERYHFGYTQLGNGGATISVNNGDLFYRLRKVPYSDNYNYTTGRFEIGVATPFAKKTKTFPITVTPTIDNAAYTIKTQPNNEVSLIAGAYPVWSDVDYFFYNKSATNSKVLSIKGTLQMFSSGRSQFSAYAIVCLNVSPPYVDKYTVSLLPTEINNIPDGEVVVSFEIDKQFSVPATAKVYIVASSTGDEVGSNNIAVLPLNFDFNIIKDKEIQIIESSFNDTYNLITNSNGRPSAIDENAKLTYFPTLIRFGQAYQSNTNLNATNRFYYEDFDEYDRSFGDVLRLHVRDRYLKVYQQFKVGNVPILTQIVKDVTGNPLQANSNQLINKIQYYAGEYGIGDAATSLAWNNFADYFVDNFRGVVCRLAQDGITPLSIVYGTNAFFVPELKAYRQSLNNGVAGEGVYTGNPCIYGVFDAYTNKYIIAMEEINRYSAPTTTTTTTTTTAAPSTTTTSTTTTSTTSTTTTSTTTTTTAAPVAYTIDSFATGTSVLACSTGSPSVTIYALPGYTTPIVTMIFYDSPSLTTPYVGGVGWRKFTYNGVIFYAGEVDTNGELTNYVTCP
jgi:hypothetical protein